jgi:ABC-2 type transport system permease protein
VSLQLTEHTVADRATTFTHSTQVISRFVGRRTVRSGVGWGVVFGLYVATQALAYATSYKTLASRRILAREFGHNVGISALVGPAREIGTVPGYTSWKCLTVLAIIGAVWGIMTSTRTMRGEEDAGRWELLIVGQVTRSSAALEALLGMVAGGVALFVTTAVITVAVGRSSKVGIDPRAALFFALAVTSGAVVFLAVGALCSQVSTSRRQAASVASAVLGASYAVRMVADSSTGLSWLRWATPLGWIEELQPLSKPRPFALVPLGLLVVVVATATVILAGRRDLGAGTLADRSTIAKVRPVATSPFGLFFHLSRTTLTAWAVSIIAYGFLLGGIAKSGGKIITSSPGLRHVFSRLGVSGADAYLSVALLIMAVAVSFVAVTQAGATRRVESSGQLDNFLVRPYSRTRWLSEQLLLGGGAVISAGLLAGLSTWAGAALDHAHVSFLSMLGAALNLTDPALVLFGAAILTLAVRPRRVSAVSYGFLLWSFLIEFVGSVAKLNHWVLDLSVFHQMAAAPAAPVDWGADGVMALIAVASLALALAMFRRRDLTGE